MGVAKAKRYVEPRWTCTIPRKELIMDKMRRENISIPDLARRTGLDREKLKKWFGKKATLNETEFNKLMMTLGVCE